MKQNTKTSINLLLSIIVVLSLNLSVCAQVITSELLGVSSEKNELLLNVAKRYPDVKYTFNADKTKLLIELPNSKYHQSFTFDDVVKSMLLSDIDFISGVSVEEIKPDNKDPQINLLFDLKPGIDCLPKLKSRKDNIVRMSFNKAEEKKIETQKPLVEPDNSTLSPEEESVNLYNNAIAEQKKGNLDEAEKLYKKAVEQDSKFYLARFNLAKVYIDKKRYDEALTALELLIKDLPKDVKDQKALALFQNTLGTIYFLIGSNDKALEQYKNALSTNPNFYQAYYNIGLVYEKEKKTKQAKENFVKALELHPAFPDAQYHLSVLNLVLKKKKEAIAGFNKVIELVPGSKLAELSRKEIDELEKK